MKEFLRRALYTWRYCSLGRETYKECLDKAFCNNLVSLRQANTVVVILAACFSIFPIAIEKNLFKAGIYFAVAAFALVLDIDARHRHKRNIPTSARRVYVMIVLYYINLIMFGIYLGVWSNPGTSAVTFMGFLIVALFLFVTPPTFNLYLTISAVIIFTVSTVMWKGYQEWVFDIANALIASLMGLIFGWRITLYRLSAVMFASKLEEERNEYYNQSTTDELTQLHNRRFFMQTFQRYLTSCRDTDEWLCIAILDVDYFKRYNDRYGHPKGDEVLRALGGVLNDMQNGMGLFTARIGGEEFAALWFEKDRDGIENFVSRLREGIQALDIPYMVSDTAERVTVSVGVYMARCGTSSTLGEIYSFADKALYEAKNGGRNRAVVRGDALEQYIIQM